MPFASILLAKEQINIFSRKFHGCQLHSKVKTIRKMIKWTKLAEIAGKRVFQLEQPWPGSRACFLKA